MGGSRPSKQQQREQQRGSKEIQIVKQVRPFRVGVNWRQLHDTKLINALAFAGRYVNSW